MPRPTQYFGSDGKTPRPALFDAEAQEEARAWTELSTKKSEGGKPNVKIPSSQLRRFFGQVMADRRQFELKRAAARDEEAQVAMALLKAGAAYAAAREPDRKPLADFAAHHAKQVKTIADFRAFARHFETIVAWHKVFEKERDEQARAAPQAAGPAPRQGQPGSLHQPRPGGGQQERR